MLIDNVTRLDTNISKVVNRMVDRFTYRRRIRISNSGSSLTDYQVKVTVDTSQPIREGIMRSDAGDIRFYGCNYWIEGGVNTSSTVIWVKVPNIISNGETVVYMYYGNPDAVSESNIEDVYDFYDDFSTDPNTNGKWIVFRHQKDTSTEFVWDSTNKFVYLIKPAQSRGVAAFLNISETFDTGFYAKFKIWSGTSTGDGISFAFYKDIQPYQTYNDTTAGGRLALDAYDGTNPVQAKGYDVEFDEYDNGDNDLSAPHIAVTETHSSEGVQDNTHYGGTSTNFHDGAWHTVEVYFDKNGNHIIVYFDGSKIIDFSGEPFSTYGYPYSYMAFTSATGAGTNEERLDDVYVRKFADPEPTVTVEEQTYIG